MPELESRVLCVLRHNKPVQARIGLLCDHHLAGLREQLADVIEFWALLPSVDSSVPMESQREEKQTKRPFPPAPIRLDVLALSDPRNGPVTEGGDIYDVPGTLTTWARLVAEERGLVPILVAHVVGSIHVLQTHLDWIAYQPWVDELARELREIRRDLAFASGQPQPKSLGCCPVVTPQGECGAPVFAEKGTDTVRCPACRASWSGLELIRLRGAQSA